MKQNYKKIICCFLITCFALLNLSVSVFAVASGLSFPDVSTDNKYFTAIEYFKEKNVIQGYTDGTFRPDQEATRAEALKIILLSSNIAVDSVLPEDTNIFPDVKPLDWFYPYIKKAKTMNIVEGYKDGTFMPNQTQNIPETLKIIFLSKGISIDEVPLDVSIYPDVTNDLWFAKYAYYAKQKNIIDPEEDGKMNAGRSLTRGELVEMMYRMDMVIANNGEPFDLSTNWPYNEYPKYAFKVKKPFNWIVVNNEDEIVFWRKDEINNQSSYEVPYPFSASVTFHLDHNGELASPQTYTENLESIYRSDYGSFQKNSLTINGAQVLNLNASPDNDDYYYFFPEYRILQAYTSYGWSDLTEQLKLEIDGILKSVQSVQYSEQTTSIDLVSEARNLILVEGQGQSELNKFTDRINIETDTIGAGNGPVDYFYSAVYDITIKYERASDTILDIQSGNTSAF